MSKLIATSVIKGAYEMVDRAENMWNEALESKGANHEVRFPNTAYYLPVIYGFTGEKIEKIGEMDKILKHARELLPPVPADKLWLPYLGNVLDAGVATLFAEEIIEALKYVIGPNPVDGIWLGAADDIIMRERGVEFVDGSAPGFAAVAGAAPSVEEAVSLARELQSKSLYVFIAGGDPTGNTFAQQLDEGDVQLGWDTRLVPFGPEITGHIYSLGFATRAAIAFGGVQPGDYTRLLKYNQNRIFAFVLALSEVGNTDYATAAGAISYGFPTIAHTNIPEILPRGVTTYEHVVSNVPMDKIVQKAIEVRGLKITITEIPIPLAYSPAFEGERVRKGDVFVEFGGTKSSCFEIVKMKDMEEVEDNKIELVGPDIDTVEQAGTAMPLGVVVEVAGRKMQKDFEPILERQLHHFVNSMEGVMHIGQRDIAWIRTSTSAKEKGFKFEHFGHLFRAKLMADFPALVDKVQVTVYTDLAEVEKHLAEAKETYHERDERVAGLTDEAVDVFYSCSLCQSFAPTHVCIISPQRLGLCGAYNWLDGKAAYEINPTGANQPIDKGALIDAHKGEWSGVNDFLSKASSGNVERLCAYSIMDNPMTSCGCFEAIIALLPVANGVMVVDRDYSGMTPCGMTFSTLAGTVGGGLQMPGFMGVGKYFLGSEKFISADGGFSRLVWLPSELKEQLRPLLEKQAQRIGDPDFLNKIATENDATTEEEVMAFMAKVGHPALALEPIIA